MSQGEINEQPNRTWESSDDNSLMRCYLGMKGRITIGELLKHFAKEYPHVNVLDVELNYSTAVWLEPPHAEDLAKRERWRTEKAERQERWERDTLERLSAKYNGLS